jgi:hypothetical protein
MELSLLCDIKILMCLYDNNDRLLVYKTDEETNQLIAEKITSKDVFKENYTDADVKPFLKAV